MNVLFITYHYLSGNGGGEYASRAYINAFAEIADNITLLYPMKEGAEPAGINKKVKMVPVWDERGTIRKSLDWIAGKSNRYRRIGLYLDDTNFDVVVFDTSLVCHGLIGSFKKRGKKVLTIHHNYQYEYYKDNIKGFLRLPILYWSKRYEREAVLSSDLNLTLTEADRQLLESHYGNGKERIEVLGVFEYEKKDHPVLPEVKEPYFLVTGTLGTVQTENSLIPWIENYYSILKDVFPSAKLTLAGKSPSEKLQSIAYQHGIEVIPSPVSMQPVLAKAKYYICATSLGGGLKLRVMDGLQAGLPVICHKVSARGYEAFGRNCILLEYDNKESFRIQLEKLKTLQINKQDVIDLYESLFSFENGKNRLKNLLITNNIMKYEK